MAATGFTDSDSTKWYATFTEEVRSATALTTEPTIADAAPVPFEAYSLYAAMSLVTRMMNVMTVDPRIQFCKMAAAAANPS